MLNLIFNFSSCSYFDRDVECIRSYFKKRFHFEAENYPIFKKDVEKKFSLDKDLSASGFTPEDDEKLISYLAENTKGSIEENEDEEDEENEDEENEDEESGDEGNDEILGKETNNGKDEEESKSSGDIEDSEEESEEFEPISVSERILPSKKANEKEAKELGNKKQKEEESESSEEESLSFQQQRSIKNQLKRERQKKTRSKLVHNEMKNRKHRENINLAKEYL